MFFLPAAFNRERYICVSFWLFFGETIKVRRPPATCKSPKEYISNCVHGSDKRIQQNLKWMQQTGWAFLEKVLLMKLLAAAGESVNKMMRSQVDIICKKNKGLCTELGRPFAGRDWVECNVYKESLYIRIAQSNFGTPPPFLLVE